MATVDAHVQIDSGVLERVDDEARRAGISRDQLIERSVSRELAVTSLRRLLDQVGRRSDAAAPEEAEAIAREELTDLRRERGAQR